MIANATTTAPAVLAPGLISWYHTDHGIGTPTALGDLDTPSASLRIADLLIRASKLAPKQVPAWFAAPNAATRPASGSHRMLAWDLTMEAVTWMLLRSDPRLTMEAARRIARGESLKVSWDPLTDRPTLNRLIEPPL